MRTRATVGALCGAAVLSALAVPAAQADAHSFRTDAATAFRAARSASAGTDSSRTDAGTGAPYTLAVSFSHMRIANLIKVGTTHEVAASVSYDMTFDASVPVHADDFFTSPLLYKGNFDAPKNVLSGDAPAECSFTSATTATCEGEIDIHPALGELSNSDAGSWHAGALAVAYNGQDPAGDPDWSKVGVKEQGDLASNAVQRYSRLTVNASPEPVRKGGTLTVTGKLSRANWEDNEYHGYAGQQVKLQFRKQGSTTYTTVQYLKTSSTGTLRTTVKATTDGYYRFFFTGTTTTAQVKATGDFVDVR